MLQIHTLTRLVNIPTMVNTFFLTMLEQIEGQFISDSLTLKKNKNSSEDEQPHKNVTNI